MADFLGFDTSNYRTSCAVYGDNIAHNRKLLEVKSGKVGLRQNDAVFLHTRQLPIVFSELFASSNLNYNNIKAVAASAYPSSRPNSYMPCFLAGLSLAKNISTLLSVPFYGFSHQQGHIMAALYSCNRLDLIDKEFIAFHVSGGTTECLLVKPDTEILGVTKLSGSLDINAGQLIDRVGVNMGLQFPAGEQLEKIALGGTNTFKIKTALKTGNCCLSGVENKCYDMLKTHNNQTVARYLFEYIGYTLCDMLEYAENLVGGYLPIVFSGGVMANSIIKGIIQKRFDCNFASAEFSGDNALGIAILCAHKYGGFKNC